MKRHRSPRSVDPAETIAALRAENESLRARLTDVTSHRRLSERVVDLVPTGVAFFDTELIFRLMNQAYAAFFGRTPEDFLGKRFLDVFPDAVDEVSKVLSALEGTDGPYSDVGKQFSYSDDRGTHETFWDFTTAKVRADAGELIGYITLAHEVTPRVRLEQELARRTDALVVSERKFRGLFELAPIGLALVEPQGKFVEANLKMQEMLGFDVSELRGLTLVDVTYPADQTHLRDLYAEILAGEREVLDLEQRCLRKDGGVLWIHCTVHLIRDAADAPRLTLGMLDITQRVRARTELQESWTNYRRLVEQCPDAIVVHSQGVVRYTNPATLVLLGARTPEDLVGRPVLDFVLPEFHDVVRGRIQRVQGEGEPVAATEIKLRRLDGSIIDVETASAAIEYQGQPASQVIVRDNTARKRAEAALRHVNAELRQRNEEFERELERRTDRLRTSEAKLRRQYEELQQLARLKDDLVNAVSHELRTPLTSIRGFAEFLEDDLAGTLTPPQRVYVGQIQEGALRLQRLVDDLLDFARIEAGSFRLARQEADLARITREMTESLRPQARLKGLALHVEIPADAVPTVVDPGRIGQVIINLISNAIKFTPAGGEITVRLAALPDRVRFEVRDTGIGIAPEHLPMLFEKFYQVETSTTRETGGAGLGLSISQALVEAHGGSIGAESELGVGSLFWFELPRGAEARS